MYRPFLIIMTCFSLGILLNNLSKLLIAIPSTAPIEICDNALDDDNDGLIDIQDPDCICAPAKPVSLIPNPSFEDQNCCPANYSRLDCADTWIQASEATTDYIHTCGFMGWREYPVPLPIPDGEGCIGFRDGRPGFEDLEAIEPNWKEYAGACLTRPLRKNVPYRFEFYVGFSERKYSPPTKVVFFGSPKCDNLPFGEGDTGFGCPTNGFGWLRLGSVNVAGENGWIKTAIEIVPEVDINAIAIGPDCIKRVSNIPLYYFFDNLVLAEEQAFQYKISEQSGHPCQENYTLSVFESDTLSYQWYKDGIALLGETKSKLIAGNSGGKYQVMITSSVWCKLTDVFTHLIPIEFGHEERIICEGEVLSLHGNEFTESGSYVDTLKTINNCDSIVRLELTVKSSTIDSIETTILSSEAYAVGPYRIKEAGNHEVKLKSYYGCDSTVMLQLNHFNFYIPNAFSPNQDGINDYFMIYGIEDIEQVKQLSLFDRWGNLIFEEKDFQAEDHKHAWDGKFLNKDAPSAVYIYYTILQFRDGKERNFSNTITLLR